MVLNKIIGLFGKKEGQEEKPESQASATAETKPDIQKTLSDIEHFVDYVVRVLVDKPEQIKTNIEKQENGLTIIRISCDKDDMGKIIGKNGKTISAIRTLAGNAAMRVGVKLSVELAE